MAASNARRRPAVADLLSPDVVTDARIPSPSLWVMACLVFAGEAIFTLPFHVARFFRPTLLAAYDLTNTELGAAQAAYGVAAMLGYFPGGILADRFATRHLLTISLLATGAGGWVLANEPSMIALTLVFAYWGVTTVLLFWAALIRETRRFGGTRAQGLAYGVLDAGRGLLAAAMASLGAWLFATVFPDDAVSLTDADRLMALQSVIAVYTGVTWLGALACWSTLRDSSSSARSRPHRSHSEISDVVARPEVWATAMIVLAAYVAYKGFDNYSLYVHQVWGLAEHDAATFVANMQWVRPVAALAAGIAADRVPATRVAMACFVALFVSDVVFAVSEPAPGLTLLLTGNVLVTCAAMFGLRGIYFALLSRGHVPMRVMGTAVGLVSVIGYTPDVFVGFVSGVLLDRSPGVVGHQHVFWLLAGFAGLGGVACGWLARLMARRSQVAAKREVV